MERAPKTSCITCEPQVNRCRCSPPCNERQNPICAQLLVHGARETNLFPIFSHLISKHASVYYQRSSTLCQRSLQQTTSGITRFDYYHWRLDFLALVFLSKQCKAHHPLQNMCQATYPRVARQVPLLKTMSYPGRSDVQGVHRQAFYSLHSSLIAKGSNAKSRTTSLRKLRSAFQLLNLAPSSLN